MGIQDRDYMRRRPDDDDGHPSGSGRRAEAVLGGFLRRNPRFFTYVGIGLIALILIALGVKWSAQVQ